MEKTLRKKNFMKNDLDNLLRKYVEYFYSFCKSSTDKISNIIKCNVRNICIVVLLLLLLLKHYIYWS